MLGANLALRIEEKVVGSREAARIGNEANHGVGASFRLLANAGLHNDQYLVVLMSLVDN